MTTGTRTSPLGAHRKLVIEGNKAWVAAGTVRQQWLTGFPSRKTPSAGMATVIARFVTTALTTMPVPLRQVLGSITTHPIYEKLGCPSAAAVLTAAPPRLWMLALAPVAAAFEDQLTGTQEARATWRTDRHSPCPRNDAGHGCGSPPSSATSSAPSSRPSPTASNTAETLPPRPWSMPQVITAMRMEVARLSPIVLFGEPARRWQRPRRGTHRWLPGRGVRVSTSITTIVVPVNVRSGQHDPIVVAHD
jgi:hypothetical protein